MSKIFVSYRRDQRALTGRVAAALLEKFGEDSVFYDEGSIQIGADIRQEIFDALDRSRVLLLLIVGPAGLNSPYGDGSKGIWEDDNWVRLELENALQRGIKIIPLLLNEAQPLKAEDLPDNIREIAFRKACPIREDPDFARDFDRLCREIEKTVRPKIKRRSVFGLGACGALMLFLLVLLNSFLNTPNGKQEHLSSDSTVQTPTNRDPTRSSPLSEPNQEIVQSDFGLAEEIYAEGLSNLEQGDLLTALIRLQRARSVASVEESAFLDFKLGELLSLLGEFDDALRHLDSSLATSQSSHSIKGFGEEIHISQVLHERASARFALGLDEAALDDMNRVLLDSALMDPALKAKIHLTRCWIHLRAMELDRARRELVVAEASLHQNRHLPQRCELLLIRSVLELEAGQDVKSGQAADEALAMAKSLGDQRLIARSRLQFVRSHRGTLSTQERLDMLESIVSSFRTAELSWHEAEAIGEMAETYLESGDLHAAASAIAQAVAIIDRLGLRISEPELRLTFRASYRRLYDLAVQIAKKRYLFQKEDAYSARAFDLSEASKARYLLEILGQSPEFSKRTDVAMNKGSIGLGETQRELLDEDTLLLSFHSGVEDVTLWAVSSSTVSLIDLGDRENIRSRARRLYESLRRSRTFRAEQAARQALVDMSRILLGSVQEELARFPRVLIVPDGQLQMIPFAALVLPDGRSLIDDHELVFAPSASTVLRLRMRQNQRPRAGPQIAVMADPVYSLDDPRFGGGPEVGNSDERVRQSGPGVLDRLERLSGSADEAAAILRLVGDGDHLAAMGFAANTDLAREGVLDDYRIVHFAGHTVFDFESPHSSALVLSTYDPSGTAIDGLLQATDIRRLELSSELIVLSSCSSALGERFDGEGHVGLTYAFLAAGATSVVSSLWEVDDRATAELMTHFYRSLLVEAKPPSEALREAQLAMKNSQQWSAPYYWSSFIFQGDWATSAW